jgi:hypothetical protein
MFLQAFRAGRPHCAKGSAFWFFGGLATLTDAMYTQSVQISVSVSSDW